MNRCVLGLTALCGEINKRLVANAGEGFSVRIWTDGSGSLLRSYGVEAEEVVYSFQNPAELWGWLQATPRQRAAMGRRAAVRDALEDRKLSDFVL